MPAEVLTLIWVSLVLLGVALLALTLVYRHDLKSRRRAAGRGRRAEMDRAEPAPRAAAGEAVPAGAVTS